MPRIESILRKISKRTDKTKYLALERLENMKDINEIMPKVPNMNWGALLNKVPTNEKIESMNKIFPHNGKWHTVFEEKDQVFVDGNRIWKKDLKSWT